MARKPIHFATYKGQRFTMYALAKRLGVSNQTLRYRVLAGWPQSKWGDPPRKK